MRGKVKLFNPETNDFEFLPYKKDPLTLEKYRYICAQIMVTRSRIQKLTQALLSGSTYSSKEAENRIKEIEKRIMLLSSKLTLFSSTLDDMEGNISRLRKNIVSGPALEKYIKIRDQVVDIERAYGKVVSFKAPSLFSTLTKEVEDIVQRINVLEKKMGSAEETVLSYKLERTKKLLEQYEKTMWPR